MPSRFQSSRRRVLQTASAIASSAAFGFPYSSARAAADGRIKIGCLNVYTKAGGVFGTAIYEGLQMYIEEHGGKIAGRPVELIREDDEFNPQVALQKVRKLVESDKVHIVAGPLGSQIASAILNYMKTAKTPWIVTGAGATELTKSHLPNLFRATLSNWQVASVMGKWAAANLKGEATIIASDYLSGHDIADAFKEGFSGGGGKVVREIFPPVGTNDFSAYISDMNGSPSPISYVFFSGSDAVRFVKQFDQYGLKEQSQLVTFQSALDPDTFVGQSKSALGGLSSSIYCETLDTPENKRYVELFQKKHKGAYPGVFDESGYTTARIIDDALKTIGGNVEDVDAFCAALAKTNIDAPRGPVSFDPVTHQAIQNIYIRKVVSQGGVLHNQLIATIDKVGDNPLNR
jgi:branched-chain amino acid transport system substrate-binding protein